MAKCGLIAAGLWCFPNHSTQWLILRHDSINLVPAAIGLRATDQTWHYEQWLHLKYAGRKRRRDASPADSKSRQSVVLFVLLSHPRAACAALLLFWLHRPVDFTVVAGMFCSFFVILGRRSRQFFVLVTSWLTSGGVCLSSLGSSFPGLLPVLTPQGLSLGPVWSNHDASCHMRFKSCFTRPAAMSFAQKCRCESVSRSKPALSFLAVCTGVQNSCLPIHFSGSTVCCRLRERTM